MKGPRRVPGGDCDGQTAGSDDEGARTGEAAFLRSYEQFLEGEVDRRYPSWA